MASFLVNETFRIEADADVRFLSLGAVYRAGDTITGLIAAEARELLSAAPEGALTAQDDEAEVVVNHFIATGGNVGAAGKGEV